eukprot:2460887-Amphidinium_carterae.1
MATSALLSSTPERVKAEARKEDARGWVDAIKDWENCKSQLPATQLETLATVEQLQFWKRKGWDAGMEMPIFFEVGSIIPAMVMSLASAGSAAVEFKE